MIEHEAPNPAFERAVKEHISAMPVARFYGFRFGALAPGEAEIVLPYRDELSHREGFFRGGVIGAVADFAAGVRPARGRHPPARGLGEHRTGLPVPIGSAPACACRPKGYEYRGERRSGGGRAGGYHDRRRDAAGLWNRSSAKLAECRVVVGAASGIGRGELRSRQHRAQHGHGQRRRLARGRASPRCRADRLAWMRKRLRRTFSSRASHITELERCTYPFGVRTYIVFKWPGERWDGGEVPDRKRNDIRLGEDHPSRRRPVRGPG